MKTQTLQEHWTVYRDKVYPAGVSPEQNRECHQAFFAGALVMFSTLHESATLTEAEATRLMRALEREVMAVTASHGMNLKAQN